MLFKISRSWIWLRNLFGLSQSFRISCVHARCVPSQLDHSAKEEKHQREKLNSEGRGVHLGRIYSSITERETARIFHLKVIEILSFMMLILAHSNENNILTTVLNTSCKWRCFTVPLHWHVCGVPASFWRTLLSTLLLNYYAALETEPLTGNHSLQKEKHTLLSSEGTQHFSLETNSNQTTSYILSLPQNSMFFLSVWGSGLLE